MKRASLGMAFAAAISLQHWPGEAFQTGPADLTVWGLLAALLWIMGQAIEPFARRWKGSAALFVAATAAVGGVLACAALPFVPMDAGKPLFLGALGAGFGIATAAMIEQHAATPLLGVALRALTIGSIAAPIVTVLLVRGYAGGMFTPLGGIAVCPFAAAAVGVGHHAIGSNEGTIAICALLFAAGGFALGLPFGGCAVALFVLGGFIVGIFVGALGCVHHE